MSLTLFDSYVERADSSLAAIRADLSSRSGGGAGMGQGAYYGGGLSGSRTPPPQASDSRGWGTLPPPVVYQAKVKIEIRMGESPKCQMDFHSRDRPSH